MEKERLLKYRRKINFISEKLEKLPERPTGLLVDAVLHSVQISIEAAMDIIAMIVKDSGQEVSDDYHNIEILVNHRIMTKEMGEQFKIYNGLRNAIVHRYNKFEEKEVTEHIEEIKNNFYQFLEWAEDVLKKISK